MGIWTGCRDPRFASCGGNSSAANHLTSKTLIGSAFITQQLDGKSFPLPKRFSPTSQRFSKGGVTFSMKKGGTTTIRHLGKTSQCKIK